ncbi:MAG TPA: DinB family protein [Symbiobacteriaceae bacterium]|nr:DinB family protein [Symbiobacteriaceae bacterium]
MNQQDMLIEMQFLRRSLARLLPELPPYTEDWRPRENMRSVWELATHLVQIPAIDLLILREGTESEVKSLEARLRSTTPAGLLAIFDEGLAEVERHFRGMPPEEFEEKIATSFHGFGMPVKAWLVEIVTHSHHHRAMLHTYLKLMGRPVDQSYIYC